MRRRHLVLAGLITALSLALTGSLLADGGDGGKGKKKGKKSASVITLPGDNVFPEGIAARGNSIFSGSSRNGTIYVASRKAGSTAVTVFSAGSGADGRTAALGMKFTKSGLLVVAGGTTGAVFVLDQNGATVGKYSNAGVYSPGGPTFLNDVTITKSGDAYITDSRAAVIYKIPAADLAAPKLDGKLTRWLLLQGSPIVYQAGFNLNGIVSRKNKYLVTVQANTGKLYRIDIKSQRIREIRVRGASLLGGDGLILDDNRLYVVHQGVVDVLKVKNDFKSAAKLRKTITDRTFDSPTTAALHKGRLYVVNSQFGRIGGIYAPSAPFTISVVKPGSGKK